MRSPCSGAARFAACICQRSKHVQRCIHQPSKPNTLALAPLADAIHSVVPVSRPHQGQTMTAHREALVKCTSAMLEQSGDLVRNCRLKETIVFSCRKLRPFKERYNFVQYAAIVTAVDILGGGVS